jgi:hypothetical protein
MKSIHGNLVPRPRRYPGGGAVDLHRLDFEPRLLKAMSIARSITRCALFLEFDPFATAPRAIAAIPPFGDDALKPHDTWLPEHDCAIRVASSMTSSGDEERRGDAN